MRTTALTVLLFLVFAVAAAIPARGAAAAANSNFVSWALDRSNECDARWSRIAGARNAGIPAGSRGTAVTPLRSSAEQGVIHGAKLSHSVITTRSFIHAMSGNERHFPLSSRMRNGASRGVSTLQSPAKARLTVPYDVRRPLNSSIQKKNFFRNFGATVSRPKLDSFGRISRADRHRSGAVSRPAYRANRPRIL